MRKPEARRTDQNPLWTPSSEATEADLLIGILQSLPAHVVVLDRTGRITFASRSWYRAGTERGASIASIGVGRDYLAVCRAAANEDGMSSEALAGITDVLADRRTSFSMEYPCDHDNRRDWFAMRVNRMPAWHGGVVVVHTDITDRKTAERETREMQLRYIMATGAGGVGVWDLRLDTDDMYIDPSLKGMLGYLDAEIPGRLAAWTEHVHPDDRVLVRTALERHLAGETALFEVEHRMVHRNGSVRWFLARGLGMDHRDGRPRRVVGTEVDVTDRRRLADRAESERRRFEGIFEGSGMALLELDIDRAGRRIADIRSAGIDDIRVHLVRNPDELAAIVSLVDVRAANSEARELFELDRVDPSLASIEMDAHLDLIAALASGDVRASVDGTVRRREGDRHVVLSLTRPDPADASRAVLGAADVTDHRQLQQTLDESRARYAIATGASRTSVWSYDPQCDTLTFDAAIVEILGPGVSQRIDVAAWRSRIHPSDLPDMRATYQRAADPEGSVDAFGGTPFGPVEYRARHTDGSWRWLSARGRILRGEDRAVVGAMGAIVDVTERRHHEAALARANRAVRNLAGQLINAQEEERKRIARELHDDVSQQVAAAAIEASLIRGSLDSPAARDSLARLEDQLAQLATLVRRLSHRMHPPALEGGLADSLRRWCDELRRTDRLNVRFVEGEMPRSLPTDLALCFFRIGQEALRNTVKHAEVGAATLRIGRHGDLLKLVVSDRGRGFDLARTRAGGLGLLSMEERIRTLGGKLEIRSRPDRGTTLRATAPLPEEKDTRT